MVSYYLPKKKVNSDGQLLPTKEEGKQVMVRWYYLPKKKVNSDGQLLPTKEEGKQ